MSETCSEKECVLGISDNSMSWKSTARFSDRRENLPFLSCTKLTFYSIITFHAKYVLNASEDMVTVSSLLKVLLTGNIQVEYSFPDP